MSFAFCPLCNVQCPDAAAHENGKKHKSKVSKAVAAGMAIPGMVYGVKPMQNNAKAQNPNQPELMKEKPITNGKSDIYCEVCNLWVTGKQTYSSHLEGRRHEKNMKRGGVTLIQPQDTIIYASEEQRAEQEHFKNQYFCLMQDVMCYITHMRSLLASEFDLELQTCHSRIQNWPIGKLQNEGYATVGATCPDADVSKKEVMFTLPPIPGCLSEVAVGSQVYVTPVESEHVDVNDTRVSMCGEVALIIKGSILIKGLATGKRPVLVSPSSSYRIDAGASPIPIERMRSALQCILTAHHGKLRELGINNIIKESDYFIRDALDGDTFGDLEGGVSPCGILAPFSTLSWCVLHDVQGAVNSSRSLVASRFGTLASAMPHLASDTRSDMKSFGTEPKPADVINAASDTHPLFSRHVRDPSAFLSPTDISTRHSHLNPSQAAAVSIIVNECRQLTLIQGPPGTGKTTTAIATIMEWIQHRRGNILATAHSNAGVDNLMEGLLRRGVRCLRVGRSSAPHLDEHSLETVLREDPSNHRRQMLQGQVEELRIKVEQPFADKNTLYKQIKELQKEIKQSYLKQNAVRSAIQNVDVVCTTCIGAGSQVLTGASFPFVLFDEATQATEPSALVPLMRGSVQVVMIGDQAQLPPTVLSQEASHNGLDVSLFDRLLALGVPSHLLDTQYRMHPSISSFSNQLFYKGEINDGVGPRDRELPLGSLPNDNPVSFINVHGRDQQQGTSKFNQREAQVVSDMVRYVGGKNVTWEEIGVITPYASQVRTIRSELARRFQDDGRRVEVSSVDGFQGREKDIVILSLVRTSFLSDSSFVAEWRRMNVSLTRARYGVIVVGNCTAMLESTLWYEWLQMFSNRCLLFDGNRFSTDSATMRQIVSQPPRHVPGTHPQQHHQQSYPAVPDVPPPVPIAGCGGDAYFSNFVPQHMPFVDPSTYSPVPFTHPPVAPTALAPVRTSGLMPLSGLQPISGGIPQKYGLEDDNRKSLKRLKG